MLQEDTGGSAYCVGANGGEVSRDNDGTGASKEEETGFTVMLSASNTVSMGIMQDSDAPTFGSGQAGDI